LGYVFRKETRDMPSKRGPGWEKSPAHLLLLTKFLHPQVLEEFILKDHWSDVLGESLQKALERFVDDGVLISPGLTEHLEAKFKVADLQGKLKERGLPVSGRKTDLISRLIEADPGGMKKAVAGLTVLQCSDRGQEIASQYLALAKQRREAVEQEVLAMLQKGKYKEASLLVSSYEAKQVFSRGLGIDWKKHDPGRDVQMLKSIFGSKPKILARLDQAKLGPLRLAAGMMELWGFSDATTWLPAGLETGLAMDSDAAARMLFFYACHQATLEGYRKSSVVKAVKILSCIDGCTCEACRKLAGKEYKLSDVPELPYEKCTSEMGCRCLPVAVFRD
jgi:hypothetical protein